MTDEADLLRTADLLRAAMDAQGVTNDETRAGIAAICMGESGLSAKAEVSYAHTSLARIREVFTRLDACSDAEIEAAKKHPERWFDLVYGGPWGAAHLGNTDPGDGWRYRGRSPIQLTGRANYRQIGRDLGVELEADPDLASQPDIAAKVVVAYIKRHYKGGGFPAMMACVGNSTPDIAARKEAYFRQFLASGEFAAGRSAVEPEAKPEPIHPVLSDGARGPAVAELQRRLAALNYPVGAADGVFGPKTYIAVRAFQRVRLLVIDGIVGPLTWAALGQAEAGR